MRVVITGGSGFVGSHLCERFLLDGHQVVCVDNYITGSPRNTEHLLDNPSFSRIEHDVSLGLPIEGTIDAVLHFASPASPINYLKHPLETLRIGSDGTFHCCELARRSGARLLLASTSEIYGDPLEHPQRESYWGNCNPIGPRSVYDEAKRFAESVVMAYHRTHGLNTRIVRIFNTYGPRMQVGDGRVVSNLIVQALKDEPITIYGDGSQTRSFCFVEDMVEGILRFMASDSALTGPINLGNPAEISIRELAERVIDVTGSGSKLTFLKKPTDDPERRRPDIGLAKATLGWKPTVDLQEGLRRTIAYFDSVLARAGGLTVEA